jgi:SAM-dependent methyltransferase
VDPDFLDEMGRVEEVHWWFRARREIIQAVLCAQQPPVGARLLDVGCGTGANLAALRDALQDADIVGLDPSDRAREVCKRRGFATIAAAATEMPFGDATFDVVTALDVLEHVADDGRAVTELQRVLRPGGIAIVTVPALPWLWGPHDERAHHRRRYLRSGLARLLASGGLPPRQVTYFNTLLLPLEVPLRLIESATGRYAGEQSLPPGPVNAVLHAVFRAESARIAYGRGFPLGLSLLAVVHKAGLARVPVADRHADTGG